MAADQQSKNTLVIPWLEKRKTRTARPTDDIDYKTMLAELSRGQQ